MQDNLREAERRIEEARRTQAESLDLGDLALSELPASLGDLPHLKGLYLGAAMLSESGELAWPGDREGPGFADLTPLAGLHALENLDLSGCRCVSDLGPLAQIEALQSLNLSFCSGVTDLEPLAQIKSLRSLELLHCKNIINLNLLAQIQTLQNLDLSGTGITDLQPLAGLKALQSLDLSGTGATDLKPLAELKALRRLDLASIHIADLQPLAGLKALEFLNLSFCGSGIADLQPLVGLKAIQHLLLLGTEVTSLQPLAGLNALQRLDLYLCRSADPVELVRVLEHHSHLFWLVAEEAVDVPREVLSHSLLDNCLPRLRTYLAELALGSEAENEVKVILLGNGRVGKTQLCRRFRGQPFNETIASTHGVEIWREKLRIQTGNQEQIFHVNWWDFGGQDIYHGTHALFLRSRAVFLVLWNPQLENRDEFFENDIPLRNQPLAYWLDYVRTLAGEDSPVIVVQSQCDRISDRRPPPARLESPSFFEASYSAKEDLGRDTLEAHLRDAIRYLLDRHGSLEIGQGRAEARRRLYELRSKDQKRAPERRKHRTLTLNEFGALCEKVGNILSWEHALDYFHHTGVVFYRPDLFANRIILDQDWALNAVYTVFHRGWAAPWLRDSGRFTREDLAWMAWQEHSPEEQKLFLGLMESCGVCFRCGTTAKGEPRYVAPDLLPGFETVKGRLHAWKEESDTPTLRLEYRFFHQAIIRGLMKRIGEAAGDLAEHWKYGFWFKDGRRDTQILVQFEDTSTAEAPGAGALVLKTLGPGPLGLLREIRRMIRWQQIGEEPEELLTLEGKTVARSALATGIDFPRRPTFAAFFEERDPETGELDMDAIHPQPLTESDKPREVYISYAWGDDKTPEGKLRKQVVDELQSALEKDGFAPVRDCDRLHPGDRISAFMRQLTRADLVVAVISDKYLRSTNCMYEIYKLWQKCQGDADVLARNLVPIVLPEVKVGNARQRATYIRYWKSEEKELARLHRDLGLSLSSQSQQEARLVREFAHHVDDILVFLNDVLMPRQLEAHLDHGFPAVREALQRRISGK